MDAKLVKLPSVTFLIPFFQQFTEINVIMSYALVLLKTIGFKDDSSLMSAIILGFINVFSTMVSNRIGRCKLFLEGGVQMLVSQIVAGILIGVKFGTTGAVISLSTGYTVLVVVNVLATVSILTVDRLDIHTLMLESGV